MLHKAPTNKTPSFVSESVAQMQQLSSVCGNISGIGRRTQELAAVQVAHVQLYILVHVPLG
eukprot:m.55136 g.55136  ORF g.55136 m.55136 type:complete len:61 (+) comp12509_c0_seq2:537-719(+)